MTRVLFDTIAAGGGHVATAHALRDALADATDGRVEGRVRDAMAELGFVRQDRAHKRSWQLLLRAPGLVAAGQRAMDAVPRLAHGLLASWLDGLARTLATDEEVARSDLVLANHPFLMTAYTRARQRYGLRAPVVVLLTEAFDANGLWAEPGAEHVLAPSQAARRHLARLGVPASRIDVVGYPLAQSFLAPLGRDEARARLDLPGGRVALLTLGGEGIARSDPDAWIGAARGCFDHVMVVCGRNEALARRLELAHRGDPSVHVSGFVSDMAVRTAAADLVLGKAGPSTVLETLAIGRPFLATSHAGLHELRVAAYAERVGWSRRVRRPSELCAGADALIAATWNRPAPFDAARMSRAAVGRILEFLSRDPAPSPVDRIGDAWGDPDEKNA